MRISDWSSDVCSSDLCDRGRAEMRRGDRACHRPAQPADGRGSVPAGWRRTHARPFFGELFGFQSIGAIPDLTIPAFLLPVATEGFGRPFACDRSNNPTAGYTPIGPPRALALQQVR